MVKITILAIQKFGQFWNSELCKNKKHFKHEEFCDFKLLHHINVTFLLQECCVIAKANLCFRGKNMC